MYNIAGRHYLLKKSTGHYFNIYYKLNTGLCCSELTVGNSWTPPEIILKDALPGFSACLDTSDHIHLLCQDEKNNLMYIRYKDGSWFRKPISGNKNEKYPSICSLGKKIYLFYVAETSEKNSLVCQTYCEDYLTSSKSIDSVRKSSMPYILLKDKDGTIFIFYIASTENVLSFKTLDSNTENWSNPLKISLGMDLSKVRILSVSRDQAGDFHLSLHRTSAPKYELIYLRIPAGQKMSCNEAVLASSPYHFLNSSLLVLPQKIIIYWVRGDHIIYCMSVDNGITWSKPEKLGSFDMELFYCTRYCPNDSKDPMGTMNADIPAMFSDGYRPAFMNEFREKEMEDLESAVLSTMKIIANIEEIHGSVNKTDTVIKKIEEKMQRFTSDYNKFILQQLQIDRDILTLKSKIELLKAT